MTLASEMKKQELCTRRDNISDPVYGIAAVEELSGSRGERYKQKILMASKAYLPWGGGLGFSNRKYEEYFTGRWGACLGKGYSDRGRY